MLSSRQKTDEVIDIADIADIANVVNATEEAKIVDTVSILDIVGIISLPPEIILFIARYLDSASLFWLSLTSHEHQISIDDVAWKNQILHHFPSEEILLDASCPTYSQFFTKTANNKYQPLNARYKYIFNLLRTNDLALIKDKIPPLTYADFKQEDSGENTILSILQTNGDIEVNHYLFDQLCIHSNWYSLSISEKRQLITLGIKLNLSTNLFRELVAHAKEQSFITQDGEVSFLYFAAVNNALQAAAMLFELDITTSGVEEASPLYIAAQKGFLEMVKLLVANKADIHYVYKEGFTPLFIAAQNGKLDVIIFLHQKGANINARCIDGSSPLYMAMQEGKLAVVDYLLRNGADYTITLRTGFTPLHFAARSGHRPCIERLLQENPQVDAADIHGSTALYVASQNGHHEVCELLLLAGANIECHYLQGYTPLYVASQNGHDKVVEVIIRLRPSLLINHRVPNGSTALYAASQNGYTKIVGILCKHDADLTMVYREGYLPLYIASQKGHEEVVKSLLKYGAPVDRQTQKGSSALYVAVEKKHTNIAKLLLEYGADTNLVFFVTGNTALHIACLYNDGDLIKLLLKHGANPQICNQKNQAPISCIQNDMLKIQLAAVESLATLINMPANACQPELKFDVANIVAELLSSANITDKIKSLLLNSTSPFEHIVILFSLLTKNEPDDKLTRELLLALGHQSIVSAKLALYETIEEFLGKESYLIDMLRDNVVNPIIEHLNNAVSNTDKFESALFCLAYFAGQVYLTLPKQPRLIQKNEDAQPQPLTAKDFVTHITDTLLCHTDNFAGKRLKETLQQILENPMDDTTQITAIKQVTINYYYHMRMASHNTANLFIGCSLLANDLEKVIKSTLNYSVPHFIKRGTTVPMISIPLTSTVCKFK